MLVRLALLTSHKWRKLVSSGRLVCRCHDVHYWCYVCLVLLCLASFFVLTLPLKSRPFSQPSFDIYAGAPKATHVSFFFPFIYLEMSLFRSIFCSFFREVVSCLSCSMAKGNRAPTAHHTTGRAKRPMELIHIDTAGPFPESLGGSLYVVMFVDSASRLQRPYGTRNKSVATILAVVKRFIADRGIPRAFRERSRVHEPFICGMLQQPRDPTRVDVTV